MPKTCTESPNIISSEPCQERAALLQQLLAPQSYSDNFFSRLKNNIAYVTNNGVFPVLQPYLSKEDYLNILNFILVNQANLSPIMANISIWRPLRLSKDEFPLQRTIHIIQNITGEYMLIVDTKLKLADGTKDPKLLIGKGSIGVVKPCWRIDMLPPQPWVNKVTYGRYIPVAEFESMFSLSLIVEANDPFNVMTPYVSLSYLSAPFCKKSPAGSDMQKISQFSQRAHCDLSFLLKNPEYLTLIDRINIAHQILLGIKLIHSQKKVHQDINPSNILISRFNNQYNAKLSDFNNAGILSINETSLSCATPLYESPEISLGHESIQSSHHKYFHDNTTIISYGRAVNTANPNRNPYSLDAELYRTTPHPSNDIWAAGITLYLLLHSSYPWYKDPQTELILATDPLLFGMLAPQRSQRLTIDEALDLFNYLYSSSPSPSPCTCSL